MIRLRRLLTITRVALRYRLDQLLPEDVMPWGLWVVINLTPLRFWPTPKMSRGERLRRSLEDLGPVFIKFGQLLSTRRDLLAPDIADELALLQDRVPPFSSPLAKATIEASLGAPVEEIFGSFDTEPMASASIAQVHAATLKGGEDVVVKVVRPGIDRVIASDMKLLYTLAGIAQRFLRDGKRMRPVEVVEDYEHTIFDELDLQREAANTSQLRRNFENSPLLYIPQIYWDYTRHNVMVMERIYAIPVTDVKQLKAQGTNMKLLAERGVEIFFTQLFRDNFFHADMHPGNIFVSREHPEDPQYMGIDCAIIGSLTDFDRYYLARNLLAIFNRDYRLVADLHIECGWVPSHTKAHEFESAIRSVCEPIFQKPLGEISFGHLLIYLFNTARRFEMEVQPSLVLLQKTLLNIEGLGRELYPELDLWTTAKPFLEAWIKQRYSPKSVFKEMQKRAPGWLEQLPKVPDQLLNALTQPPFTGRDDSSKRLAVMEAKLAAAQRQQRGLWMLGLALGAVLLNASDNLRFDSESLVYLAVGAAIALLIRR
ncbi:MAG TPA: ubiquinone biosynthesis regulatory protein kinase UbiB [Pseudomonadales bacterium]|nr:ubiquinone biosynthesis regulatory protein kinase UbiB [Pseudomonadales bacterium]